MQGGLVNYCINSHIVEKYVEMATWKHKEIIRDPITGKL